jgi:hypothetical protein
VLLPLCSDIPASCSLPNIWPPSQPRPCDRSSWLPHQFPA